MVGLKLTQLSQRRKVGGIEKLEHRTELGFQQLPWKLEDTETTPPVFRGKVVSSWPSVHRKQALRRERA